MSVGFGAPSLSVAAMPMIEQWVSLPLIENRALQVVLWHHQVDIFRDAAQIMIGFIKQIRAEGFDPKYLNIGGGLGIDYYRRCALAVIPLCLVWHA